MSEDENNGLQQRINKLGAAKSAALARVAELEAAAQESAERLAGYDALASRVSSLEGDLANARQARQTTEALVGAGVVDGRARRFLAYEYGQLEGEKPEFAAWLEGQRSDEGLGAALFRTATATTPAVSPAAAPAAAPAAPEPVPVKITTEAGSQTHLPSNGLSLAQLTDPNVSLAQVNADWAARRR